MCELGVADSVAAVDAVATQSEEGHDPQNKPLLQQFVEDYVSAQHRDAPEEGCTVAALTHDAGRSSAEIQRILVSGIKGVAQSLSHLRELDSPGQGAATEPDFAALSTMIGALTLSRAVAESDPGLSDTILGGPHTHRNPGLKDPPPRSRPPGWAGPNIES